MHGIESRSVWGGSCVQYPWDPTGYCNDCGESFGQTMTRPNSLEEWKAYHRRETSYYWRLRCRVLRFGRSVPSRLDSVLRLLYREFAPKTYAKRTGDTTLSVRTRVRCEVERCVESASRAASTIHNPLPLPRPKPSLQTLRQLLLTFPFDGHRMPSLWRFPNPS